MRWLLILLLSGCATPMTEEEREYNLQITYEKWLVCKEAYRQAGGVWYTTWTRTKHEERTNKVPRYLDMRIDLGKNNCHGVLKRLGYD